MKKSMYLTTENINQKTTKWLSILSEYYSQNRKIPIERDKIALLIIDMQEYFLNPQSHAYLPAAEAIIKPINSLKKYFIQFNQPVIFLQYGLQKNADKDIMSKWWGKGLKKNDEYYKISEKFNTKNSLIIEKSTYDSFLNTNLQEILEEKNCSQVIITGVATHLCCETTARSAFTRGFDVFLPVDAMASYTEEIHLNTLKAASNGFGTPTRTERIIQELTND